LIGSSNLTENGLKANRELSVVMKRDRDIAFEDFPLIYDNLWNYASVLTKDVLNEYQKAHSVSGRPSDDASFDKFLKDFIVPTEPESVVVGSGNISKERSFMQTFRRKYDEVLIPAHDEILEFALNSGFGRPEYQGSDPQIEMGRFLGWLRLVHGHGDLWREVPLIDRDAKRTRISDYVNIWQSTDDTVAGDMYHAGDEIENIANIRKYLCDDAELADLDFDTVFSYLCGCHAFLERLRFVSKELGANLSGRERLRLDFQKRNKIDDVKKTISYLLSGSGDPLERAYDCIYNSKYKLEGFGEASVMELLGWGDPNRPPFNNRTVRGIRFLGYDVEHLVAGG
jgi:hypothetical protein